MARLNKLDDRHIVFTPGYFYDGDGREFFPRESIALISQASKAPIYAPFDTFIGLGVVGGRMATFDAVGRFGAEMVADIFSGRSANSLAIPKVMPTVLNVDWRQVERWKIDQARLPQGTIVHFRPPESRYWEMLVAAVVVLLQAGLISGLLIERHRRHRTEAALQKHRFELAHASRLAMAGELTGSIAHEIRQPLAAILSNASAAELILASGSAKQSELRDILADIRRDDLRASEVIRRLRALLDKHEVEHATFDVNAVLHELGELLRSEAQRRQATLRISPAPSPVLVNGDRIQIQQVLINLVLNAFDSVAGLPPAQRLVIVSVELQPDALCIVVEDRGQGIPPENKERIFESFFTTKESGMGLGLSIGRTLIEAHGGKIRVENSSPQGAAFHVILPRVSTGALA